MSADERTNRVCKRAKPHAVKGDLAEALIAEIGRSTDERR